MLLYKETFYLTGKTWVAVINQFKKFISTTAESKTMKKIIIAAAILLTTGILSSCTRVNSGQIALAGVEKAVFINKKDLGSGD
jgi:hypothetical protein